MKQSKGLNDDLKPEQKKTPNRTTMSATRDINTQAPTIWNIQEEAHQTHDVYTTSPQRRCNVMTLYKRPVPAGSCLRTDHPVEF